MTYIDKIRKDITKSYEEQLSNKDKEIFILKKENRQKDEIIKDLDKNDYKGKYEQSEKEKTELFNEIEELKKNYKRTKNYWELQK